MATVGPPGAFRRITVHYSSVGDEANDDVFLDQEALYQSIMAARTPGSSECPHHWHGESSSSGTSSSSRETSRTSDEQIAADFAYARRLQEEMEALTIERPPVDDDDDEQDDSDISCVPSPSDTDDDNDGDQEEEAAGREDDNDGDGDDDVDPDNMTYEQRQELAESVGSESRGLSDELMRYLVPWKYKSGSGFFSRKTNHQHDDCSVCLSAFKNRESIITLPCKHSYHAGCITRWLKIDKTCPVCKYEVFGPS